MKYSKVLKYVVEGWQYSVELQGWVNRAAGLWCLELGGPVKTIQEQELILHEEKVRK